MKTIRKQASPKIAFHYENLQKELDLFCIENSSEVYEESPIIREIIDLQSKYSFRDYTFEQNGHVGLKNVKGEVLVPPVYSDITIVGDFLFRTNLGISQEKTVVAAANDEGRYALVYCDGKGTPKTDFIYYGIRPLTDIPYYTIREDEADGKFGLVTTTGHIISPCELDAIGRPVNDLTLTYSDDKIGILTSYGLYISPIYDETAFDKSNCLLVRWGNRWGYLDMEGQFIDLKDKETLDRSSVLDICPCVD